MNGEYKSDNKDTMAIIGKIDALGGELRKRFDDHLRDCRARHNGTNLQQMNGDIEKLQRGRAVNCGEKRAAVRAFDVIIAVGMLIVAIIGLIGVFK